MKFVQYKMEDVLEYIIDYRGKTPNKSDNGILTLSAKSVRDGYIDYVLWSTFRPLDIDLDGELEMECIDSGMLMSKEPMSARGSTPDCYYDAFRTPYDESDVIELMEDGV